MLTLVIGGVRSGKSAFAVRAALGAGGRVVCLVSGVPSDAEMRERIEAHRRRRPPAWRVCEEPLAIGAAVPPGAADTILFDSVDGWIGNRMEAAGGESARFAAAALDHLRRECLDDLRTLAAAAPRVIAVSAEVGHSLVAPGHYGRAFSDLLGSVNQGLAAMAGEAYLVVAGIPLPLHPHKPDMEGEDVCAR